MNRVLKLLTLALVAQLILALTLHWSGQSTSGDAAAPLFAFDADAVSRITISAGEGSADIVRRNGEWVLPKLDNAPAAASRIAALLDQLKGLRAGWPVARTPASHARFEVSETNFQRRIRVFAGEAIVADLLLGSTPGFRQTHARKVGDNLVYAIGLSLFEVPARAADWRQPDTVTSEAPEPAANGAADTALPGPQAPAPDD